MIAPNTVKQNLCIHDKRNPDYYDLCRDEDDSGIAKENCGCDNCYEGRHTLAVALLDCYGVLYKLKYVLHY